MIYIATCHSTIESYDKVDLWLDIQYKYIKRYTDEEFKIFITYNGIMPNDKKNRYYKIFEKRSFTHIENLNFLSNEIMKEAKDDDIIIFIDGDAFPIDYYVWFVKEKIEKNKLVAIQRREEDYDRLAHPSFCATTIGFWKKNNLDWNNNGESGVETLRYNSQPINDAGALLCLRLDEINKDWYKMLRTNKNNDFHGGLFGIYEDLIYHHGCGFRGEITRNDLYNSGLNKSDFIIKNKELFKNIYDIILSNEKFYEFFIGNKVSKKLKTDFFRSWFSTRFYLNNTWLGFKIFKNAEDLLTYQKILFNKKPDLIIETGTYEGGSALFLASICNSIKIDTHIITIDVKNCVSNKIKNFDFSKNIEFINNKSSISDEVITYLKDVTKKYKRVMVILDSDHSKEHVLNELNLYSNFVTSGQYLICEDTAIDEYSLLNYVSAQEAVKDFLTKNFKFKIDYNIHNNDLSFNDKGYLLKNG